MADRDREEHNIICIMQQNMQMWAVGALAVSDVPVSIMVNSTIQLDFALLDTGKDSRILPR